MHSRVEPHINVVTPVYNGEMYLPACIESVLAQEYDNWEYIIVNNCSTDGSLKIAKEYARIDSRIIIHDNSKFLSMVDNFHHSLRQISPKSTYCKVVHADDWLFPNCLKEMVKLAEANPTVGVVSSYVLEGNRIKGNGFPYPSTVLPGKEICRLALLGKIPYVFGSPSSLLLRSDLIRLRKSFYNERYLQLLDQTACYEVLQDTDFGFVHQILSYSRLHDESQTSIAETHNRFLLEQLILLAEYGQRYLSKEELEKRCEERLSNYYRFLGKNLFRRRGREFWDFHINGFEKHGCSFKITRLLKGALAALYFDIIRFLAHPKKNTHLFLKSIWEKIKTVNK
jgi:glycosyltransferase involved in cell wall biosynthesis